MNFLFFILTLLSTSYVHAHPFADYSGDFKIKNKECWINNDRTALCPIKRIQIVSTYNGFCVYEYNFSEERKQHCGHEYDQKIKKADGYVYKQAWFEPEQRDLAEWMSIEFNESYKNKRIIKITGQPRKFLLELKRMDINYGQEMNDLIVTKKIWLEK